MNRDEVSKAVLEVHRLLSSWGLGSNDWMLVDSPALVLAGSLPFVDASWHSHLNVYVNETRLPWLTKEREETIPPPGSKQLEELVNLIQTGFAVHLVPAERYLSKGIEANEYRLPDGTAVQIATLRGLFSIWIIRAFEFLGDWQKFGPDAPNLSRERSERLITIELICPTDKLRDVARLLRQGYDLLSAEDVKGGADFFSLAREILENAAEPRRAP